MAGKPVHGHSRPGKVTATYRCWQDMKKRCTDKNNSRYSCYGGRGIEVCERWSSFVNFLHDMGERPDGLTLERNDNDGPYAPWNCKWATMKEQNRNKTSNTILHYHGKSLCLVEWAEILKISPNVISARLYNGWTVDRALSEKVRAAR